MQLFDFDISYGKFNQEICAKLYQNRPNFVKDMTKTFWCVFSVHI